MQLELGGIRQSQNESKTENERDEEKHTHTHTTTIIPHYETACIYVLFMKRNAIFKNATNYQIVMHTWSV